MDFTIIGIEDSDYPEGDQTTKGVKITTKEFFSGNNKFHTTRVAIVTKLSNQKLREDIAEGDTLKVKCAKVTFKNGKDGFDLVDVKPGVKK